MNKPKKFIVKKSQIPGAGKGLWANQDFQRGELIVKYEGEKITRREAERRNEKLKGGGAYFLGLGRNKYLDAQNNPRAFGRYVNDAAGWRRIAGLRNNAWLIIFRGEAFFQAARNIKAGEEILAAYGVGYWKATRKLLEESKTDKLRRRKRFN